MQANLIDEHDPDFNDYCNNTAKVQYSVLQNSQNRQRPFCQDPFKVATVCLSAFCLLLLMILVATNVHSKSSSVQDPPSGSPKVDMLKTCANVTELRAEVQTLRKEKSDLEKERSVLKAKITALEALPAKPCTPVPPTTPSTRKQSCPDNWKYFSGSCYFISDSIKSWSGSRSYCNQNGGDLAIILTADEQTFVWNLLPRGHWNAFWIGITDDETEDEWRWVDGTKLVGGFWEDGEPNNHIDEDCGYIVKTQVLSRVAIKSWYDAPCYMSRYWICEKKSDASS